MFIVSSKSDIYPTFVAVIVRYCYHYTDVIMSVMASQITSLTIVHSTVYSGTDQRKHQSSTSLAFVRGIHRGLVNSPHQWPVTWKMFPFDDVIMYCGLFSQNNSRKDTKARPFGQGMIVFCEFLVWPKFYPWIYHAMYSIMLYHTLIYCESIVCWMYLNPALYNLTVPWEIWLWFQICEFQTQLKGFIF